MMMLWVRHNLTGKVFVDWAGYVRTSCSQVDKILFTLLDPEPDSGVKSFEPWAR